MITPRNRKFLDDLPNEESERLYEFLIERAIWRLRRWAGVTDTSAAEEVVQEAYRRLLDPSNHQACWDEWPPTIGGLREYLVARMNDDVKNRSRERQRQNGLPARSPSTATLACTPESALYTEEIRMQWLEAAEAASPKLGEFVLHWLERDEGEPLQGLAKTLEVEVEEVYRMAAKARNLFRKLIEETEAAA